MGCYHIGKLVDFSLKRRKFFAVVLFNYPSFVEKQFLTHCILLSTISSYVVILSVFFLEHKCCIP